MRVLKFGGSSIADAGAILTVIGVVQRCLSGPVALVFSAIGSTTDRLQRAAELAAAGRLPESLDLAGELRAEHLGLARALVHTSPERLEAEARCQSLLATLEQMLRSIAVLADLSPPVAARLLGLGELLSTRILSAALAANGVAAHWVDARELVVTDSRHLDGEPDVVATFARCRQLLPPLLDAGQVPVTQGFIARSATGVDTTLGRGGSDYSAALLGAALAADEIEIWTDVDGIMTADPSLVPGARRIPEMSFQEAAELALFGARVLHPRTLTPAIQRDIPVRVLSTGRPDGHGTVIRAEPVVNGHPVKSIAYKEGMRLITLTTERMFQAHGFLRRVFAVFERSRLLPDVVATSEVSVAIAVRGNDDLAQVVDELRRLGRVELRDAQALVVVVGERLKQTPGIVGQVFAELADVRTSLVSLGGSEINLGFVVQEAELPRVVCGLHRRFFEAGAAEQPHGGRHVA